MHGFPMPAYASAALDLQYTNTGTPEAAAALAALRAESAAHRKALPFTTHRYGPDPLQTFDVFRPATPGPVGALVFVHGGQWQLNTSAETSFWAAAALAHDLAFVAVNFPKVPDVRIGTMAQSIGLAWSVIGAADDLALDPSRLILAGHSSGAHLAALAVADGLLGEVIQPAAVLLYSGMYDLEPLRHTSRNTALGLGAAEAARISPASRVRRPWPATLVAVGGDESAEFQRQAAVLHAALGAGPHRLATLPGKAHFTTPVDLYANNSEGWNFIDTNLLNQ